MRKSVLFLLMVVSLSVQAQSKKSLETFAVKTNIEGLTNSSLFNVVEEVDGESVALFYSGDELKYIFYLDDGDYDISSEGFGLCDANVIAYLLKEDAEIIEFCIDKKSVDYGKERVAGYLKKGFYLFTRKGGKVLDMYAVTKPVEFINYLDEYRSKLESRESNSQGNKLKPQSSTSNWAQQEVPVSTDVKEEPGRYNEIKVGMLRSELVNYGVNPSRYKSKVYKNSQGTYEILSPILTFEVADATLKALFESMPHLAAQADDEILKERPYITIVGNRVTKIEYKRR